MTTDRTVIVPPQIMSRQVGDETVILDLASGMYFALDRVGARVWQLLVEGQTVGAVVSVLMGEFDVARDQLQHDVDRLVQELVDRGLVRVGP